MRPAPLVIEGYCELSEEEGGFCPACIIIGDTSLDILLAQHVGASCPEDTGSERYPARPYALRAYALKDGTVVLGRIRITVEFLPDA